MEFSAAQKRVIRVSKRILTNINLILQFSVCVRGACPHIPFALIGLLWGLPSPKRTTLPRSRPQAQPLYAGDANAWLPLLETQSSSNLLKRTELDPNEKRQHSAVCNLRMFVYARRFCSLAFLSGVGRVANTER